MKNRSHQNARTDRRIRKGVQAYRNADKPHFGADWTLHEIKEST